MILKKRVRNVDSYLIGIRENEEFYITCKIDNSLIGKIENAGFSSPFNVGYQILPSIIGPISRFNANGGFIRLKNLPMETCYREVAVKDWHGNFHYVDVPYKRYQRQIINPPGVELKIIEHNNEKYVLSPILRRVAVETEHIKHIFNLFLELFGCCETLNSVLSPTLISIPTKRVNWKILPEGSYPWPKLASIAGEIASKRAGKSKIQEHSINLILRYKPKELVYGTGGFRGYLIFKFPEKNLFVMENVLYGNATYVFENDWESFSQLTKAEIITNNLQKERIEHRVGWEMGIDNLLK